MGRLWLTIQQQSATFWLICLYLLFEYVRPQEIYPALSTFPFVRLVLILALILHLADGRGFRIGPPEAVLGLFTAIVLLSSFQAVNPGIAFDNLPQYITWVLVYLLIANIVSTEQRFLMFVSMFFLFNFKMSLHGSRSWAADGFAFRDWGTSGAPGWFENSGEFGVEMCVFLPAFLAFVIALRPHWPTWKRLVAWFVALTAITGIAGSGSRGAIVGIACVALWVLPRSKHKLWTVVAVSVVAAFIYFILPPESRARFAMAGDDHTSMSRRAYWDFGIQLMNQRPLLGIGYANWSELYRRTFGIAALPHNIFVQAGAELGYTGLSAFIGLIICTLVMNHSTRRILRGSPDGHFMYVMAHGLDAALIGYLASGFFVTVLFYPYFWINLAMTVGLHRAAENAVTVRPARLPVRSRRRMARLSPASALPRS